jgi:hypothetical protein
MCVFALSWFFAKMFFNRKVKATRSTVLTIFEYRLMYHCCYNTYTTVQANIFFLYGEIMLFLQYRFKFFTCFPKMQQIILWLWCMNWNKRVSSERRKSHFRGPRCQNFMGEDTPGHPYKCEVLGISQLRNWIHPWCSHTIVLGHIISYFVSSYVRLVLTLFIEVFHLLEFHIPIF